MWAHTIYHFINFLTNSLGIWLFWEQLITVSNYNISLIYLLFPICKAPHIPLPFFTYFSTPSSCKSSIFLLNFVPARLLHLSIIRPVALGWLHMQIVCPKWIFSNVFCVCFGLGGWVGPGQKPFKWNAFALVGQAIFFISRAPTPTSTSAPKPNTIPYIPIFWGSFFLEAKQTSCALFLLLLLYYLIG